MTRQKPRKDDLTLKEKKKRKEPVVKAKQLQQSLQSLLEIIIRSRSPENELTVENQLHHPSSLEPRAVCASYRSVRAETADCHRTETGRDEGADWRTDWRTHRGQSADTGKRLEHRQRVTWNIKPNMEELCRHIPRRRKLQIIFQRLLLMLSRLQNETSS